MNKKNSKKYIFSFIIPCFLNFGCADTVTHELKFEPQSRLKVAVLPFVRIDDEGNIKDDEEARLLIDNLSLSLDRNETPTQIIRRMVLTTLEGTNLRLISKELIDVDLPHAGFALEGNILNYEKLYQTSARALCEELLGCDAVLFGKVLRFERRYFGIESVHEVALEFELVSARDNQVLFNASGADYETRGVTKGPTGFSSLVIEPIQGLDLSITENLARNLVQRLFEPLARKTPLKTGSEGPPPAIFAAAASSFSNTISQKNPLIILALASPNSKLTAEINNREIEIPLIEQSQGHYVGAFYPFEEENIKIAKIELEIEDAQGQKVRLPIKNYE